MLTLTDDLQTDSAVLGGVLELSGELARHAPETDRTGVVPEAVCASLRAAGCVRMAVGAEYGGADLSLPEVLAVVETLARADASAGWLVGQVALSQVMIGYLPRATLDRLYGDSPDVWVAGAAAPKGRLTERDGGWRVSGRWPLVSGVSHARWVFLQGAVVRGRTLQPGAGGVPELRLALLAREAVEVIETWNALGLRATASHDVQVRGAACPDELTCKAQPDSPDTTRLCRIPSPAVGGPLIAASVLGTAAGALAELVDLGVGKRPSFSARRLGESERFRERLGDAGLTLAAARALLRREAVAADARGATDTLTPLERARLRAAAVRAIELAVEVTEAAFTLGGSSSVVSGAPLERRLRDVRTAAQHFAAAPDFYQPLGAHLTGAEPLAGALA
jgi:alkylation response protein AidB-like acyl-CoA dehydrogenase